VQQQHAAIKLHHEQGAAATDGVSREHFEHSCHGARAPGSGEPAIEA
jgi:hypothetical protein